MLPCYGFRLLLIGGRYARNEIREIRDPTIAQNAVVLRAVHSNETALQQQQTSHVYDLRIIPLPVRTRSPEAKSSGYYVMLELYYGI